MNRFILLILLSYVITSCGGDDAEPSGNAEIEQWLMDAGLSANQANGLYYYSEVANAGGNAVQGGDVVALYYTLRDLDGNILASQPRSSGDSLLGKVGAGAIFPVNLDQSLTLMRSGEVFSFLFPPKVGYGDVSAGVVPNDQSLQLTVEIAAVFSEGNIQSLEETAIDDYIAANNLDDPPNPIQEFGTGIAFKVISAGTGSTPNSGDTVVLNYNGRFLDGQDFDNRTNFSIIYGSDNPRALLNGFEFGIDRMQINEQAILILPSSQGYKESALVIPDEITNQLVEDLIVPDYVSLVPPYSTLIFQITRVE